MEDVKKQGVLVILQCGRAPMRLLELATACENILIEPKWSIKTELHLSTVSYCPYRRQVRTRAPEVHFLGFVLSEIIKHGLIGWSIIV